MIINKELFSNSYSSVLSLKFSEITCGFFSVSHSLTAEEGTASSPRSSWRTTTLLSRTLNMRAGTWPSAERVGQSRPPKPGRTSGKFTSSSASTKDRSPSQTQTSPNTLSSSTFHRPDGPNATENPTLLPNTMPHKLIWLLVIWRGSFIFIYFTYLKKPATLNAWMTCKYGKIVKNNVYI